MKKIIREARTLALLEIEKYGAPLQVNWEFSNQVGQNLAKKIKANRDIVMLGCILMDIKLGEAAKDGQRELHTQLGAEAGNKFLNNFELDRRTRNAIINCIEAHHATVPFTCKEAEICANADCYRFIHPLGFFAYLNSQGSDRRTFLECIDKSEAKLDEKYKILSIDICKRELDPYYHQLKGLIKIIRETIND
jgi:hypothetical protein